MLLSGFARDVDVIETFFDFGVVFDDFFDFVGNNVPTYEADCEVVVKGIFRAVLTIVDILELPRCNTSSQANVKVWSRARLGLFYFVGELYFSFTWGTVEVFDEARPATSAAPSAKEVGGRALKI